MVLDFSCSVCTAPALEQALPSAHRPRLNQLAPTAVRYLQRRSIGSTTVRFCTPLQLGHVANYEWWNKSGLFMLVHNSTTYNLPCGKVVVLELLIFVKWVLQWSIALAQPSLALPLYKVQPLLYNIWFLGLMVILFPL